eukprot:gene17145-20965_t
MKSLFSAIGWFFSKAWWLLDGTRRALMNLFVLLLIGLVGIWRYSMGGLHFIRGMLFLYVVYPHYRRKVRKLGKAADPSHVFLLVTSFRID